jgi:hypothetical protein
LLKNNVYSGKQLNKRKKISSKYATKNTKEVIDMANTQQQLQMHHILEDGSIIDLMPVTTSLDVQVGSKSNGSLTLPGNSASEVLSDTISNIRKYLYNLTNVASTQRGISTDDKDTSTTNLPTTSVTTKLSNAIDAIDTRVTSLESKVTDSTPPISHASSATTYGIGTASLYGHVKLSDTYASKTSNAAAANGIGSSQNALYNAYNALNSAKAATSHASTATTYGVGSSTTYGHVKTQGTISTASTDAAEVPTQAAVKGLYDTVVSNKSAADTSLSGKAPTSHASTDTTYGIGSTTNYGHLKINDQYSDSTSSTTSAAANAVAASSWAVYRAYSALTSTVNGKAPTSHASSSTTYGAGSASNYGHVKLSDNYSSSAGAASAGVGASSKAVYDAYAALSSNITTINSTISSLKTEVENMATTADLLTIYKKCSELGATPDDNDADGICTAIQKIYDDQYSVGVADTKSSYKIRLGISVNRYLESGSANATANISLTNPGFSKLTIIGWTTTYSYYFTFRINNASAGINSTTDISTLETVNISVYETACSTNTSPTGTLTIELE